MQRSAMRGSRRSFKGATACVALLGLLLPAHARAQFATFPSGDEAPQAPQRENPNGSPNGDPGGSQGGNGNGNPLLGAWSWQEQANDGSGIIFQTIVYRPDGGYVVTYRIPSGSLGRFWGSYQTRQTGQNQVQVSLHQAGYLPQQICTQSGGALINCRPLGSAAADSNLNIAFTGPNSYQFGALQAFRDPSPQLAQLQVPATAVIQGPPPYGGGGGGGGGYERRYGGRQPEDDDLQQRRICAINDGELRVVRGKLTCVK